MMLKPDFRPIGHRFVKTDFSPVIETSLVAKSTITNLAQAKAK